MSAKQSKAAIAQAYWPIVRGYMLIASAYYGVMTVGSFFFEPAETFAAFVITSAISSLVLLAGLYALNQRRGFKAVFLGTCLANAVVLLNIEMALYLAFDESKLVYFIIAAIVFSLSSTMLVQSAMWTSIALGLLAFKLYAFAPEQGFIFAFLGFAAAAAGTTISHYLRRAIVAAKEAENLAIDALLNAKRDLDEEKNAGKKHRKKALSDMLTGLANRRAFFSAMREQTKREDGAWLALLDLDGFKSVNDNHGHVMGDELLKSVSERLKTFCIARAHVSRIGGDEFGIVIAEDLSETEVVAWMEKLLARLGQTYLIEGRLIQISGSIGCCRIDHGENESTVFKCADFALLHAKRSGKNRVITFDDEHARAFAERFEIEKALRDADLDAEIELLFQPQLDLRDDVITRAEVLARWHSPRIGSIAPDDFISVAEECGLMMDITTTVLRKALDTFEGNSSPLPLSINLSAADLNSKPTMNTIVRLLEASPVDPTLIEFEVTESAMIVDEARGREQLSRLAERGHTIAIDDFGTGYSNFNYLRSLPIHKLKIDRSFLEDLQDPMTEKILRSLVGVANTLDVECLIEGVEDELGLVMAKRSGVGMVQGFLIGRPSELGNFEPDGVVAKSA